MAAREKGNVQYVEQLEKLIAFIASTRTFRQDGSELATGVTTVHLDQWVKSDPVEQPVMCHSLGTGYKSHRRAPTLSLLLVFKQRSVMTGNIDVRRDTINLSQTRFFRRDEFWFCSSFRMFSHAFRNTSSRAQSPFGEECNTSMTRSHRSRAEIPSIQRPRMLLLTWWSCEQLASCTSN